MITHFQKKGKPFLFFVLLQIKQRAIAFLKKKKTIWHLLLPWYCIFFLLQGVTLCYLLIKEAFFRWKKPYRSSLPVISVGNLVVGGTGKTPFTLLLARKLSSYYRVAILSRGYRSQAEHACTPFVFSWNTEQSLHPSLCGDEVYLMARQCPDITFIVNKNRRKSAREAEKRGIELLLLDDGLQQKSLKKDVECILLDAKEPFGSGYLLPYGTLRDLPRRLQKADTIVVTRCSSANELIAIKRQIKQYSVSHSIIPLQITPQSFFDQYGKPHPAPLPHEKAAAFCAIGNPDQFFSMLKKHFQITLVDELHYPDHDAFSFDSLYSFAKACQKKGAQYLVCTEKDWVKRSDWPDLGLRLLYVTISFTIPSFEYTRWN